jgi:capsule polysaccharide export protein KpsE/RkpR
MTTENDSFYKHYHKEIKVNLDEIPIVLAELIDAAYNYI